MSTRIPPNRTAQRILLAKVGLDGHDRGIKVVARGLRDAGFHVIYGGIWQSPEAVARAAADEDVAWLGLSSLSGSHMTLVPRVLKALRDVGAEHVQVLVGGIVPEEDIARLQQFGVAHVFGPGTSIDQIVGVVAGTNASAPISTPPKSTHESHRDDALPRSRNALARAITEAARGERAGAPAASARAETDNSRIVAVTGSAGVGKSSLIGKLVQRIRMVGKTVAVLACDPESPLTGGALLGDRVRMTLDAADDGVFVRSLTVPSGHQSIARNLDEIIGLTRAFGFDVILLETAGAGQGDTAIRALSDVLVLLLQPETGDQMQWQKAGLLEIADIVVIHKADLPAAARVEAEVREQLNLPGSREVPIVCVSAYKGEGVDRLWEAVEATKC